MDLVNRSCWSTLRLVCANIKQALFLSLALCVSLLQVYKAQLRKLRINKFVVCRHIHTYTKALSCKYLTERNHNDYDCDYVRNDSAPVSLACQPPNSLSLSIPATAYPVKLDPLS